jgi:hypothetical protein
VILQNAIQVRPVEDLNVSYLKVLPKSNDAAPSLLDIFNLICQELGFHHSDYVLWAG